MTEHAPFDSVSEFRRYFRSDMRLKPLQHFIHDHTCAPHPDPRTVQRWPGAKKLNGRWYMDLDEWTAHFTPIDEVRELEKDPIVASLLKAVS